MGKIREPYMNSFLFVVVTVCVLLASYLLIPAKDAMLGVPYQAKMPAKTTQKGFKAVLSVPGNVIYRREIGFILSPPVPVSSIRDAPSAVEGKATVEICQAGHCMKETIELGSSGWRVDSGGVWSKVIARYDPVAPLAFDKQRISVTAEDLNFDVSSHQVTVYLSRDRRK